MLTPRFFFTEDFRKFQQYFLEQPHRKRAFRQGDYLWEPGAPFQTIHYILSGIAQNYVEHENGHRKIISFHGSGTVFPGYHQQDYKIERSIITKAISDMQVLEFTKAEFQKMFEENSKLTAAVVEWFSMYVNLLLYDTAHQEYNHSFLKLCNLLYLLLGENREGQHAPLKITQADLADLLGISRVNLTRGLTELRIQNIVSTRRKQITVVDLDALKKYCSAETL